jgi:amino-acid N-acetyltransferase
MPTSLRLRSYPLHAGERGGLAAALARSGLPADDVEAPGRLFWRFELSDQIPVGFGGLELHGRDALLRSVVTLPQLRGRGIGRAIVEALEAEAATSGCRDLWLLTLSARPFFEELGYAECAREAAPEKIRATDEFSTLCPASATVMRKRL